MLFAAVGASSGTIQELDIDIYKTADTYIAYMEHARKELAHLLEKGVEFKGEVGAMITGGESGSNCKSRTIYHSLGMAVEDCAAAQLVYDLYCSDRGMTNK